MCMLVKLVVLRRLVEFQERIPGKVLFVVFHLDINKTCSYKHGPVSCTSEIN